MWFLSILTGMLILMLAFHPSILSLIMAIFLIWQLYALKKSPHTQGLRIFNQHHWLGLGILLLIVF